MMKITTTLFPKRPVSSLLLLLGLLLTSTGLALLSFSSAQAQCVLLNETFDANPVLAGANTDGA